jgi:hypothetical protein
MFRTRRAAGTRKSGERKTLNVDGFPKAVFPW